MSKSRSHDPLVVERRHARIAGWGTPDDATVALAGRIRAQFDRATDSTSSEPAGERGAPPSIPASRIDGTERESLERIVRSRVDDDARRALSLGKSYPDLIAARGAELDRAADIVIQPADAGELRQALVWCAERSIAIVPVGGGTSVVGGIEPIGTSVDQPVAAIDMSVMNSCLDVDVAGGIARFEAGIRGPDLESALAGWGRTLGHVPQSFEYATLGGWVATRSAGQQCLRYGKIERMTAALELVTTEGVVTVDHLPAHGAGPDLRELIMGSEGQFGVISSATMRISPRPTKVRFATWLFPGFEEGVDAVRALVQAGVRPATVRLSDPDETAFSIGSSVPGFVPRALGRRLLGGVGWGRASMAMFVIPGVGSEADRIERQAARVMRASGGRSMGPMPARHWYHSRFRQPYARDLLIDSGLVVDTLETAVPWGAVIRVHDAVRRALTDAFAGIPVTVGCHLSHLYRDGASMYFTFLARCPQHDLALERWRAAKTAVHAELARHHAATSHQHGVGTMHAGLYQSSIPDLARSALMAARSQFDPHGLCNPGKLFDQPPAGVMALNAVPDSAGGGGRTGTRTT